MKPFFILFLTTAIHLSWAAEPAAPEGMKKVAEGSYLPLYLKDAKPRAVSGFSLDEHAVTNAEYLAFVLRNPRWQRSKIPQLFADKGYLSHWAGDTDMGKAVPAAPVTHVSWFAARAYLQANGRRLPTTDEWEFAALADPTRADASKDPAFTQQLLEWYSKPAPAVLPAAAAPEPNFYGIRGLHGMAWEWVSDFNNAMDTGEGRSGGALERDLYCAGGAASVADKTNYAAFMRYALRASLRASYTMSSLSFRGAWSPGTVAAAPADAKTADLPPMSVYHTTGTWRNQRNEATPLRSLGTHWQVLCMGYTSCKFACPRITADMRGIERALPDAVKKRTQFTFASIDPERDTPAHLKAHAEESGLTQWNFITTDSASVRELAAVLGVKYAQVDEDFAHSNTIVVLNPAGEIVYRQDALGASPDAAVKALAGTAQNQ